MLCAALFTISGSSNRFASGDANELWRPIRAGRGVLNCSQCNFIGIHTVDSTVLRMPMSSSRCPEFFLRKTPCN
jgi:hypothetical protein